jgi:hypothetical protein
VDRELDDWTIFTGQWAIGRIYEVRGALPDQRWYWSFFGSVSGPADMTSDGHAPTLEVAKIQFAENWRKWLAWTALAEKSLYGGLLENYRDLTQNIVMIREAVEEAFGLGVLPSGEHIPTMTEECEAIARAIHAAAEQKKPL